MRKVICPFCNKEIHDGDQVCVHCGKSILNAPVIYEEEMKIKPSIILFTILGVLLFIVIVFLVIWFGVLS